MTRSWYKMHVANAAEKRGEIFIYEQIGEDFFGDGLSAKRFITDLKALGDLDTLDVHINSPGGAVFDGQAIYTALKTNAATTNVFVDGLAASIASVIAMAGDTVTMPGNALMMIHDPFMLAFGDAEEMRKAAEMLDKIKDSILVAYADKTGLDRSRIADLMSAETWMTAEEAKSLGFVDIVSSPAKMAAGVMDFNLLNRYQKAPHALFLNAGQPGTPVIEPKKGEKQMTVTLESIKNEHKAIADTLIAEGHAKGLEEGKKAAQAELEIAVQNAVKSERERIQGIEAHLMPGHEDLINELKYDGKTSPDQAAAKILAAEKASRQTFTKNLKEDGNKAVASTATNAHDPDPKEEDPTQPHGPITEEEAKNLFEKDERVRKAFTSARNFFLFRKHEKPQQ